MPLLDLLPLAASESNLLAAREQMAFTLAFHIVLSCIGVALPATMMVANYVGLKKGDEHALELAKRWSKAMAVTFAVGAVTGTVLSFEFGLLWPEFMDRFGAAFGVAFAIEGIFFFLEAIFLAVYIYGWKRLGGWAHFWSGVPMVITGIGGAFSVVAANAWMNQPQGFTLNAAGEVVDVEPLKVLFNPATGYEIAPDQTEYFGGICTEDGVKGAIGIPGLDSFLVGWSTDTKVIGLNSIPDDEEPPAHTLLHLSFDAMVGIGSALLGLALWFALAWWKRRDIPQTPWFLRAVSVSGGAAIAALWCGWIVTEVGRQPWIVNGYMRTSEAVTEAEGIWFTFGLVLLLYAGLGTGAVVVLRGMSRRWREKGAEEVQSPYAPQAEEAS